MKEIRNNFSNIESQLELIVDKFEYFLDGTRVIMLLHRAKDGGHNKEHNRRSLVLVGHNKEQNIRNIHKLLLIKNGTDSNFRIYMSCNQRCVKKAERLFKIKMLEMDFNTEEARKTFYERLESNWHSSLMEAGSSKENNFIIDVDDINNEDLQGDCLKALASINIDPIISFKTKNGWHVITPPFNPVLYKGTGEIKKDGQLLLSF